MELQEFIKETLLQIVTGVKEAQALGLEHDAVVNPAEINDNSAPFTIINDKRRMIQTIEFEVGLTSTEGETSKAGIGVVLGGVLKGGANKSTEGKNSAATNIRFNVPVALPVVDNNNTPYTPRISSARTNRNSY